MKIKETFFPFFKKASFFPMLVAVILLCLAATYARHNTFIIYEGESKTVYNSPSTKTADFIADSGIVLTEDKYFDMPEEVVDGVAKIYIKNKNVLKLTIDGEVKTLYALEDKTISDVLTEYGISLNPEDIISLPLGHSATDGLSFEITRISHITREETQEIPFTTEKRPSAALNKGKSKVIRDGVPGAKKLVYDVRLENGKETSRKLISETVTKKPEAKIVEYGTHVPDTSGTIKTKSGETLQYKKVLNMTASAYTTERSSDKVTATGQIARVGLVAVDRRVIPLGSRLYIVAADGKSWTYGIAVAADTGVRGNRIDLFFNTYRECINFGIRKAKVYVLK